MRLLSVALVLCYTHSFAQSPQTSELLKNWYKKDYRQDKVYGISLKKAYEFLQSKKLRARKLIVAVIDDGIDTLHEDLRRILWINNGEIANNKLDDDKNGYPDDVRGWNFLVDSNGSSIIEDNFEYVRHFYKFRDKFQYTLPEDIKSIETTDYTFWKQCLVQMDRIERQSRDTNALYRSIQALLASDSVIRRSLAKEKYALADLKGFVPRSEKEKLMKQNMTDWLSKSGDRYITNIQALDNYEKLARETIIKTSALYHLPSFKRDLQSFEDINAATDTSYGNADVMVFKPTHGTHVSGIIGADRSNHIGIEGIVDNVRIMMIRVVPKIGDEYDNDVALAIRYAVNNGANIINMSFGKSISPNKKVVDNAIQFAKAKGALIVQAAGNDAINIDSMLVYPNPKDSILLDNWITVGASTDPRIDTLAKGYVASFSNFGSRRVDLFAPGVQIFSCLPDNNYGFESGTSMAAPVVSSIAALIWEYFPGLTAKQVKTILMKSTVVPKVSNKDYKTDLKKLSRSGGIVNAYNAVRLAFETTSKGR